tara:strand:- start:1632 stop:1907 length:276 start_codon:yes stop_codon:yes gene_type:complete
MDWKHCLHANNIYGFYWKLLTMTEKCKKKWVPTEDQINNIIIPAMQGTAHEYAQHATELKCPPEFIALMLRDVADTFEENALTAEIDCDCC